MVEIIGNVIHVVIDFTDKQMQDRKRRRTKQGEEPSKRPPGD